MGTRTFEISPGPLLNMELGICQLLKKAPDYRPEQAPSNI